MKARLLLIIPFISILICGLTAAPERSRADGIWDYFHPANCKYKKEEPYRPNFGHHNMPPMTVVQLANVIDILEHDLHEDGTVVIQQPSVWGQARMTRYRNDFERKMKMELCKFATVLSARIARSDSASLQSQTSLAASLSPGTSASSPKGGTPTTPSFPDMNALASNLLKTDPVQAQKAFDLLKNLNDAGGNIGLEPPIYLDEEKRYIDHLNELRRVNLGDDIADSAGYGMYLVRMPVSIEPGQKTDRGHGAMLTVTAEHDFNPFFLQRTFRNLVINDLVDQLTPILFEVLDHNMDKGWKEDLESIADSHNAVKMLEQKNPQGFQGLSEDIKNLPANPAILPKPRVQPAPPSKEKPAEAKKTPIKPPDAKTLKTLKTLRFFLPSFKSLTNPQLELASENPTTVKKIEMLVPKAAIDNTPSAINRLAVSIRKAKNKRLLGPVPATIVNGKTYPVAPSDKIQVFVPGSPEENLNSTDETCLASSTKENLAAGEECFARFVVATRDAQHTVRIRATDVGLYLQHELEAAYDIMERGLDNGGNIPLTHGELMDQIARDFHNRSFTKADETPGDGNSLEQDFEKLMKTVQDKIEHHPMGFLCWAIAVDAALLNERLRNDIIRITGQNGFHSPFPPQQLLFYLPPCLAGTEPNRMAAAVFQEYVKARWPLITFSLDPVVDQQNIMDAMSLSRDLQLAVSFAFSTGQISFSQMLRFHRQITIEAETIALNRTVTCFSHRNDTFGWRFTPRYQNPPMQTNPRALVSMLWRTAPGPNYQINKSKLERGQRELTAIIIMPSFLNQIRMEVRGNYFKLTHPENLTISSARMLEQGRFVKELLETHGRAVVDAERYRPDDTKQLFVKLQQVEKMLPMQIYQVQVPYENTLGGFDLFVPGTTALVPILVGYDGVDQMTQGATSDVPSGAKMVTDSCTGETQPFYPALGSQFYPPTAKPQSQDPQKTPAPSPSPSPSADGSKTAFFLYGKHFSLVNTKVVAGGRYIPDDDVEILSREVMRIRIPSNVQTTGIKGKDDKQPPRPFVEIHVATPNGISNRILIPLKPLCYQALLVQPTTPLMTFKTKEDLVIMIKNQNIDGICPDSIKLAWNREDALTPKKADIQLAITIKDKNGKDAKIITSPRPATWDEKNGYFTFPGSKDSNGLSQEILAKYKNINGTLPVVLPFTVAVVKVDDQPVFDVSGLLADPLNVKICRKN